MTESNNKDSTSTQKDQYMEFWEEIKKLDEKNIKLILENIRIQTDSKLKREKNSREIVKYLKTPLPYIAVIIGIIIPLFLFLLFLWASLKLE